MPDQLQPASSAQLQDVHVVINSYGREARYIERAVASMLRQKFLPARIHFIDQNDTPLQLDLGVFAGGVLVQHHRPDRNCSRTRNLAQALVPSGWIAFADDDACWADDYSEQFVNLRSAHPGLQMIAGSMYNDQTGEPYSIRHRIGGRLDTFHGTKLFYGANFLIRSDTLTAVGGYDPRIGPGTPWASSEDADLCWRVVTSGVPVQYAPQLRIMHPPMHSTDLGRAIAKAHGYGLGRGALCVIWITERRHYFGLLELIEMSTVPLAKLLLATLKLDRAQVRIQFATLSGRIAGFLRFLRQHPRT